MKKSISNIEPWLILMIFFFAGDAYAQEEPKDREYFMAVVKVTSDSLSKNGLSVKYLKIRGWAYAWLDSLDQSLADYSAALKIDSLNSDLLSRKADVEFDMGNYDKCVLDYTNALQLAPDSLSYLIGRGLAYHRMQKYSLELVDLNTVLATKPGDETALRNRAVLYCGPLNNLKKGIADWNDLLKRYPTAEHFNDLGLMYLKRSSYSNAIENFSKAISLDLINVEYLTNRAFCRGMIGLTDQAMIDFAGAEKLNPDYPLLYLYRGKVKFKLGKREEGCRDLQIASKMGIIIERVPKGCHIP